MAHQGLRQRGDSWEAWVWSPRDKKKLRKTFSGKGAYSAAKNWRADALKPVREGTTRAPTKQTLRRQSTSSSRRGGGHHQEAKR